MMGIGFPELMIILVIIMIIFGAGKLPEIGSAFGRSIKNFKTSMKEAEAEDLKEEAEAAPAGEVAAAESEQGEQGEQATTAKAAAKKEEEMIDDAALEIKEKRIGTIQTKHDGLVQESDVFTSSLKYTPGGRGSDRGVSRDVF